MVSRSSKTALQVSWHMKLTVGACCLQDERDSFGANLLGRGLVDSFRRQYPEIAGYTWWSRRLKCRDLNKGWRLDYFLVHFLPLEHPCWLSNPHCMHSVEAGLSDGRLAGQGEGNKISLGPETRLEIAGHQSPLSCPHLERSFCCAKCYIIICMRVIIGQMSNVWKGHRLVSQSCQQCTVTVNKESLLFEPWHGIRQTVVIQSLGRSQIQMSIAIQRSGYDEFLHVIKPMS